MVGRHRGAGANGGRGSRCRKFWGLCSFHLTNGVLYGLFYVGFNGVFCASEFRYDFGLCGCLYRDTRIAVILARVDIMTAVSSQAREGRGQAALG